MTTSFRTASLLSTLAATSMLVACSGGGEPGSPQDRLASVQSAIAKPSGTVSATSMKTLATTLTAVQAASPVFATIGQVGSNNSKCASGGQTSGSLDLSCATQGSVTGSIDYAVEISQSAGSNQVTVTADYKNACSQGVCVSGSVIVDVTEANNDLKEAMAVSADITEGTTKTHLYFGSQEEVVNNTTTAKIVLFDNKDDSYVFEATVNQAGASYSVDGANGSFQCSVSAQGGQCSGSASFSF